MRWARPRMTSGGLLSSLRASIRSSRSASSPYGPRSQPRRVRGASTNVVSAIGSPLSSNSRTRCKPAWPRASKRTARPTRMGFSAPDQIRRVLVAPAAASISWAKGRVPHPLGDVAVAWERRDDGLHLVVSAPEGVPVDVAPAGPFASLPCHVDLRTTPVEV